MRAGQNVAGDADHVVHAHGQGAITRPNHRCQASSRVLRRELVRKNRLVLDNGLDEAAADYVFDVLERAGGNRLRRPVDRADVLRAQSTGRVGSLSTVVVGVFCQR
jgi:hypothetical protein